MRAFKSQMFLIWVVFPVTFWGLVFWMIGGSDAFGFYLRALGVLTVISVVGVGAVRIWDKIGGSING